MNKKLVAYAMGFASFLMQKLGEKEAGKIKSIILFGSASRGEAGKGSDIDIFIDTFAETGLQKQVDGTVESFYKSQNFKYWELLSITNPISCIVGRLGKWKSLKPSIIANGIALYSKYTGLMKGKSLVIVYWGSVRPESKRVLLSKKLYGYSFKGKAYPGIYKEAGVEKLGSNCISVPLESSKAVLSIFKGLGIQPKTIYASAFG